MRRWPSWHKTGIISEKFSRLKNTGATEMIWSGLLKKTLADLILKKKERI